MTSPILLCGLRCLVALFHSKTVRCQCRTKGAGLFEKYQLLNVKQDGTQKRSRTSWALPVVHYFRHILRMPKKEMHTRKIYCRLRPPPLPLICTTSSYYNGEK